MRTIELKANIPLKIKKILKNSYKELKIPYQKFRVYDKPKIFCIGLNKTGTTSLKMEMLELGFVTGDQRKAELLVEDWAKRDFSRLVKYCQTAQFFQDVPFSYPYTFIPMDQAFPRSKFILTIRSSAEEWYHSLIQFHGKLWGNGNVPPTAEDLKNATYLYKGRPYRTRKLVHQVNDNDLYNKDVLIKFYERHNQNVIDYFRHRPEDLLVINLKEKDSYSKFCNFLEIEQKKHNFPWENKT